MLFLFLIHGFDTNVLGTNRWCTPELRIDLRVGNLREVRRGREGRGASRLPRPPHGCGGRRAGSGRAAAGGLGGHLRGLLAQPFGTYA